MLNNWWQHIHFAYPWLLSLWLFIPAILYAYIRYRHQQTASLQISTTHFLKHTHNYKTRLVHLPILLRCFGLFFCILSLAKPQAVFTEELHEGEGIDMVLCFDISGSMTEKDFSPNRLEAAKQVAKDFVEKRPGDRIGVVIFSSQSFTLCPITTDHPTVLKQIENIHNGYLPEDGTAIGSGLATSVDRLKQSNAKSKVVILLTDGVDFGGIIPPDIAKNLAKTYGIKVYCIGIGSEQEMDVNVTSVMGTETQHRKMSFNADLLKEISSETGGQYYQAADKASLEKIYSNIGQLEKNRVQISTFQHYSDAYLSFIIIGGLFIVVELLLRLTLLKKFP